MSLTDILMSPLAMLDYPASILRSAMAGRAPTANPFSFEGRAFGEDVVDNLGLPGGKASGLLIDLLADPLHVGAGMQVAKALRAKKALAPLPQSLVGSQVVKHGPWPNQSVVQRRGKLDVEGWDRYGDTVRQSPSGQVRDVEQWFHQRGMEVPQLTDVPHEMAKDMPSYNVNVHRDKTGTMNAAEILQFAEGERDRNIYRIIAANEEGAREALRRRLHRPPDDMPSWDILIPERGIEAKVMRELNESMGNPMMVDLGKDHILYRNIGDTPSGSWMPKWAEIYPDNHLLNETARSMSGPITHDTTLAALRNTPLDTAGLIHGSRKSKLTREYDIHTVGDLADTINSGVTKQGIKVSDDPFLETMRDYYLRDLNEAGLTNVPVGGAFKYGLQNMFSDIPPFSHKIDLPPNPSPIFRQDQLIADQFFSARVINSLKSEGIETMGDLVSKTPDELLQIRNFGDSTLAEVRYRLEEMSKFLKGDGRVSPAVAYNPSVTKPGSLMSTIMATPTLMSPLRVAAGHSSE